MASKIRIHRSTGAAAPSSLEFGELAATVEQGTAGNSANKAGRLFIGNVAGNPVEIGGEYTYKLLDHTPGELHLTSALVTDANANINGLRIAGIATITRTDITDTVTQNLRVTGVGTFVAGLDLNGNVTIGNQHTDILTINSRTGVSTDMTLNNGLKVVGLSTFSNAVDINSTTIGNLSNVSCLPRKDQKDLCRSPIPSLCICKFEHVLISSYPPFALQKHV